MYMLGWKKDERRKVVQNNLAYIHLVDPSPGENVYILATSLSSQSGIDHLHFAIESDPTKKLVYGTGSSSIAVFRERGASTREAAGEMVRRDASSRDEASTSLPPSQPTSSAPPHQPPVSILRRPSSESSDGFSTSKRRRRHVSFAEVDSDKEKEAAFMLVNVPTKHPKIDKKLAKILGEVGLVPQEVRFESLPFTKGGRYVYFFKVDTSTGCSHVENMIENKKWHELFNIESINSEDQQPFMWHALPMNSIIEATFLSQRFKVLYEQHDGLYHQKDLSELLIDNHDLGLVIKDDLMREQVIAGLNRRGQSIYQKWIKHKTLL
ncbi:hypothetical protein CAEBREN_25434 [Caenorhabditis brenneri]|uniref:Uncharacterized protein n=1 Tax=Caenorhabditis brenneri TaxID=135651 RepID=G0NJ22_CAEBE|nr:hypothetical protein CAEBREN_25434 [Caenorhabditis brenneri]